MAYAKRTGGITRYLAGSLLICSLVATATPTFGQGLRSHSHRVAFDYAYGYLGYGGDYGPFYDPTVGFTYDPAGTCYEVTCDEAFSDPGTNYLYDSSMASEVSSIDSAESFDAYIREDQPVLGVSGRFPAVASPTSFRGVGQWLGRLTSSTAAPIRSAAQAANLLRAVAGVPTRARSGSIGVSGIESTSSPLVLPLAHLPQSVPAAVRSSLVPATAGTVATFVDSQRTYKIDYPSNWILVNHDQYVRGAYVDVRLGSPDANVGLVGQSLTLPQGMSFSLEDPNVQSYLANSIQFAAFGAQPTGQPELQAYTIPSGDEVLVGRVPFEWVDTSLAPSQFTNVQEGMQGGVLFVALHNNGRLYIVTGTIADLTSSAAVTDARQLSASFSSLDLLHIYTPTGKPDAIEDATHTYRLAFPSTWSYTKSVPKGDTALVSRDHTSAVVALAAATPKGMQKITSSYMHSVVASLGSTLGSLTSAPTYHRVVVKGSTRYAATVQFRRADGRTGKAMVVATVHHGNVCAVVGITMDGGKSIKQEAQQESYIVSSLHLI
jgi:hypothetical protein